MVLEFGRYSGVPVAAIVACLFQIVVRVEARHAAEEERGEREAGPFDGLAVPAVLTLNGRHAGARDAHRCAASEAEFDRPRHQIQMRLTAHLAPKREHGYHGNQE
jgi:hypothetical protein